MKIHISVGEDSGCMLWGAITCSRLPAMSPCFGDINKHFTEEGSMCPQVSEKKKLKTNLLLVGAL